LPDIIQRQVSNVKRDFSAFFGVSRTFVRETRGGKVPGMGPVSADCWFEIEHGPFSVRVFSSLTAVATAPRGKLLLSCPQP
jgi:hypothetical protein